MFAVTVPTYLSFLFCVIFHLTCFPCIVIAEENNYYSCSSYTSCEECSQSTYCHWCSYDEACHMIGSWYGCAYGADCYSIERCQRYEPETVNFSARGVSIMTGIGLVMFVSMLLWGMRVPSKVADSSSATAEDVPSERNIEMTNRNRTHEASEASYGLFEDNTAKRSGVKGLVLSGGYMNKSGIGNHAETNTALSLAKSAIPWSKVVPILTAAAITAATICFYAFFPRIPQFNICSSEIGWKSILDGMMDAYMQASFGILVSVYNPNLYDINLDLASGSFKHNDKEFGTFNIPPVAIKAHSITDDVIAVTFAPEDWEAYTMMSEYLDGALNFTVSTKIGASFPALFNMSFSSELNDIFVNVSSSSDDTGESSNSASEPDRHLCKCQQ